jgi:hypothetical protein
MSFETRQEMVTDDNEIVQLSIEIDDKDFQLLVESRVMIEL